MLNCLIQLTLEAGYAVVATPEPEPLTVRSAGAHGFVMTTGKTTLWTGSVPASYLCGDKTTWMFYPSPKYTSTLTIDWLGVFVVFVCALAGLIAATGIWPLLIWIHEKLDDLIHKTEKNQEELRKRLEKIEQSTKHTDSLLTRAGNLLYNWFNPPVSDTTAAEDASEATLKEDPEDPSAPEEQEEPENPVIKCFVYSYMSISAALTFAIAAVVAQVLCSLLGLPNITKRTFTNKCYMIRYELETNTSRGSARVALEDAATESSDWEFKLEKNTAAPHSMVVQAPCDATFHTTDPRVTYEYIPESSKQCRRKKVHLIRSVGLFNKEGDYYSTPAANDDDSKIREYNEAPGSKSVEIFNSKILYKADDVPIGKGTYKNNDLETDADFIQRLRTGRGAPTSSGPYGDILYFGDLWRDGSWCFDWSSWKYWKWMYTSKEIKMKYDVLDVEECETVVNHDTGFWRIDNSTGKPTRKRIEILEYSQRSPYDTRPYGWLEWKESTKKPLNEVIYTTGIKSALTRSNLVDIQDSAKALKEMRARALKSIRVSLANWEFYPAESANSLQMLAIHPVAPQCKVVFNATVTEDMWEFKKFCKSVMLTTAGTNVTKISTIGEADKCLVPLKFLDGTELDLLISSVATPVTGLMAWRCTNTTIGVGDNCSGNAAWVPAKPAYNSDYTEVVNIEASITSPDYSQKAKNTWFTTSTGSLSNTLKIVGWIVGVLLGSVLLVFVVKLIVDCCIQGYCSCCCSCCCSSCSRIPRVTLSPMCEAAVVCTSKNI